ncbi:peptidoglycan DD-metalloendopeptidase family protein [Brevibacillus sp. SYP-B805]|uniref:murein hydrolase activator EnvC family protein n=1 Tax=Brevibacillus sp. SYP-B805 TaxID=1578199 RepID=UPI0013EDABB0|nr:peptidoglycan DD-metalloendopeptidase family protein [Brevibacillus sp. SYP-B805]NGQ95682.1 peptidoglycan DD-metalloendopeptidase family protein [Brevibacillus sp. SYP-B805]
MRKKILLTVMLAGLLAGSALPASVGVAANKAASLAKINKELEAIRQKKRAQQSQVNEIEQQIKVIKNKREDLENELMAIDLRRNETQKKLDQLEKKIDETTQRAAEAQEQLDQAEERVAKREGLLKSRVKSMYERGNVSYLEVLLGAADFGDFLTRMQGLQLILEQDTRILEDNLRDKETIAKKKKEIEQLLANYENMYAQAEALKAELDKQFKHSTVIKAELEKQEEQLHEIEQEEEQKLLEIAQQEAAKVAERNRLQSVSSYKGGRLALPIPEGSFRFTSGFGMRTDPFTGKSAGHNGVDMAAPRGTPIHAAADGIVIFAGYSRGFGNTVMIKHNEEITTLYGHIREGGIKVHVGQAVKQGDVIAEVGSTGRSTGNHLHFTVYRNNVAVDPMGYLR